VKLRIMPMLTGSGFAPPVSIDIPTLDEMYYDPMKARPTRNPPSELRLSRRFSMPEELY
jgi:hypothetical protein